MANINLLTPGRIGGFDTRNRIMMAPMTRSRAHDDGVPSELAITYYEQRASAGLIATEGVAPTAVGRGYARTPSIQSAAAWVVIGSVWVEKGLKLREKVPMSSRGMVSSAPALELVPVGVVD